MRDLSILIPSRNYINLVACVDAIRAAGQTNRIIVIDDGLERRPRGCEYVQGIKNFIFARAINQGIRAAGSDDVVILNDDALLQTPGGFSLLAQELGEHPQYGLIAATCDASNMVSGVTKSFDAKTGRLVVQTAPQRETAFFLPQTVQVYLRVKGKDIEFADSWRFLQNNLMQDTRIQLMQSGGEVVTIWILEVPR